MSGLSTLPKEVSGVLFRRRTLFQGRWIKHGGMYPVWLLRLWRNGVARCEDRWMDEHMALACGHARRIKADLIHDNANGLDQWLIKHVNYATRECADCTGHSGAGTAETLNGQAAIKRWIKENVYSHCPLYGRALAYWAFRYFILLGFLDGVEGFAFHFLQGLWYRTVVDVKIRERQEQARA